MPDHAEDLQGGGGGCGGEGGGEGMNPTDRPELVLLLGYTVGSSYQQSRTGLHQRRTALDRPGQKSSARQKIYLEFSPYSDGTEPGELPLLQRAAAHHLARQAALHPQHRAPHPALCHTAGYSSTSSSSPVSLRRCSSPDLALPANPSNIVTATIIPTNN